MNLGVSLEISLNQKIITYRSDRRKWRLREDKQNVISKESTCVLWKFGARFQHIFLLHFKLKYPNECDLFFKTKKYYSINNKSTKWLLYINKFSTDTLLKRYIDRKLYVYYTWFIRFYF